MGAFFFFFSIPATRGEWKYTFCPWVSHLFTQNGVVIAQSWGPERVYSVRVLFLLIPVCVLSQTFVFSPTSVPEFLYFSSLVVLVWRGCISGAMSCVGLEHARHIEHLAEFNFRTLHVSTDQLKLPGYMQLYWVSLG